MQFFAKFLIVCEKYTILDHLIALEHTTTKPVVFFSVNNPSYIRSLGRHFITSFSKIFEVRYIYPNPRC